MMTTKTPHGPGSHEACAALVNYKGKEEACKRAGSYPDPDGKRFWCGLHRPETCEKRERRKEQAAMEVQEAAMMAVENKVKAGMTNEILGALKDSQKALIEISNMKDHGWPDGTPADKYQALLSHLNMVAANAQERVAATIRKVSAEIGRASRSE